MSAGEYDRIGHSAFPLSKPMRVAKDAKLVPTLGIRAVLTSGPTVQWQDEHLSRCQ